MHAGGLLQIWTAGLVGLAALAAIGGGVILARKLLSSQLPKVQKVRLGCWRCLLQQGGAKWWTSLLFCSKRMQTKTGLVIA